MGVHFRKGPLFYWTICIVFSLLCGLGGKSVGMFFAMMWLFTFAYLIHCIIHRHMEGRKRKMLISLAVSLVFLIIGAGTLPKVSADSGSNGNLAAIAAAQTQTTSKAETTKETVTQTTTAVRTTEKQTETTIPATTAAKTEETVPLTQAPETETAAPETEPEETEAAAPEEAAAEEPETEAAVQEDTKYTYYTITSTNVYSSDSSDSEVLTTVDAFAEVPAYTTLSGSWVHVNVDGADGYISEDDLSTHDESSFIVYISATGQKYHSGSKCGSMKNGQKISLADARARGYTACAKCRPPEK